MDVGDFLLLSQHLVVSRGTAMKSAALLTFFVGYLDVGWLPFATNYYYHILKG